MNGTRARLSLVFYRAEISAVIVQIEGVQIEGNKQVAEKFNEGGGCPPDGRWL